MLAHSPRFPLVIYYTEYHDLSAKDEAGIMLALQHRDRVCCISLRMPAPSLQKVIATINDEFPILEFLSIGPPTKHNTHLILPSTFQAPQLRLLDLKHFASLIGSPLLFFFLKHRFIVLADATGHKYINSGYLQGRSHLTYVRDCSQCVQMCVCMLCLGWVWAGHFGKGVENGDLQVFKELA